MQEDHKIVVSNLENIEILNDEKTLSKKLTEINIKIPVTKIVSNKSDAINLINEIGLPVDIKAIYPFSSYDREKINEEDEKEEIIEKMLTISKTKEIEIKKNCEKYKIIEIQLLSDLNGNVLEIANQESILRKKRKIVKISPIQSLEDDIYSLIINDVKKVIKNLNLVGVTKFTFYINTETNEYLLYKIDNNIFPVLKEYEKKLEKVIAKLLQNELLTNKLFQENDYNVFEETNNKIYIIDELCEIKEGDSGNKIISSNDIIDVIQKKFLDNDKYKKNLLYENMRIDELIQILQNKNEDVIEAVIAALKKHIDIELIAELTKIDIFLIRILKNIFIFN